ncbi:MAG: cellulase family glycosylhydrolase [Chryseosolibacter sp.]
MRFSDGSVLVCVVLLCFCFGCSDRVIREQSQLTRTVQQYERADFQVILTEKFDNPYDANEIALNMAIKTPSGDSLLLPCYFDHASDAKSTWMARFSPQEAGEYSYRFEVIRNGKKVRRSAISSFDSSPSGNDGFLHIHDHWTLKFDSGKPFRGIGENVGWESRSFSNPKWNYDYLLPTLANNGANFFRAWMSPNNFPLEWKKVKDTKRYADTDQYFNPGAVRRLDEVLGLADSLGLYMMLAFDSHNALMENNQWEIHNYNVKNGGPAKTPLEFFTLKASREKYKNRLRYIVARWGYSTNIAAWEFFNEIDNAAHTKKDSVLIPHEVITSWHREMAAYLKSIDPYDHIVTTSVSHREIAGIFSLDELDLNQMHIYKRTQYIPAGIQRYIKAYGKPFSWGEFGYEWDWNKDFKVIGDEMDFDYKRGLWYGLFSPTPILPMTWWWEFFDERGMTPYFRHVREINERMLKAGNGSFEPFEVSADGFETFGVKCGDTYFVYVLNNSKDTRASSIHLKADLKEIPHHIQRYNPGSGIYQTLEKNVKSGGALKVDAVKLDAREEVILIISSEDTAS